MKERNRDANLFTDEDCWWFFIQSDPKALELRFDDSFIAQRFQHIQNNKDEITCAGNWI